MRRGRASTGRAGFTQSLSSSRATIDLVGKATVSSPFLPLAVRRPPGDLDIDAVRHRYRIFADTRHDLALLEHLTEDFAADIGVARLGVRHHAPRRRQDGDAEAVIDARQVLDLGIDPPARLGDAAISRITGSPSWYFSSIRSSVMPVRTSAVSIAADIAFALQHFAARWPAAWRPGSSRWRACRPLSVADAGQHIAQGIGSSPSRSPLPARLDHAGNLSLRGQIAQRDARQS